MLKLGYKASAEQFAPKPLLDFSVEAERNGFDSVFVSDHFQPWKHTDGHAPSALAWLGALGASTQRIVMGTSVLTPTFRYHPSVVAQVFGTLGAMFPGRVILGDENLLIDEPQSLDIDNEPLSDRGCLRLDRRREGTDDGRQRHRDHRDD